MPGLSWYVQRVRKMGFAEYPYRFALILRKLEDRFFFRPFRPRFAPGPGAMNIPKADPAGIEALFPGIRTRVIEDAEKILRHRFEIFGIDAEFGNPIDWHLDPKTGRSWPLAFWGLIDYKDGETIGGIKFAWELNRLNHLPRLAAAFALSGDRRFRNEIFRQLESWRAANPYPKGINWIMGIELGIRIANVVWALRFLGAESLTEAEKQTVVSFVAVHARHLARYPSKHSSAANHSIAEAMGLFIAGSCFPGLAGSGAWKRAGRATMIREVERQIYPDGGGFEQSLPYLNFVQEMIIVFIEVCRVTGQDAPAGVEDRLRRSLLFLSHLVDRGGNVPAIGDGDDGFILKLWFGPHNHALGLLNAGAVILGESDWIPESASFDEFSALLLGPAAAKTWARLRSEARPGRPGSVLFPDSGLAVIRGLEPVDLVFVGNGGRLGAEPLGAHGHADALSFWLSAAGEPVFVDPGTYLFHGGGEWRNYFRSTAAHNTIRVDGLDQAEITSDFMFGRFYKIADPEFADIGDGVSWSAGHEGYRRLKDPVIHRRLVIFNRRLGRIEIDDVLRCRGRHYVESRFHFHPDRRVERRGDVYRITGAGANLDLQVDEKWIRQELVKGSLDPMGGWYSPSFNVLQETVTLVLGAWIEGNTTFNHAVTAEASGRPTEE
jgi:hypothetical protein